MLLQRVSRCAVRCSNAACNPSPLLRCPPLLPARPQCSLSTSLIKTSPLRPPLHLHLLQLDEWCEGVVRVVKVAYYNVWGLFERVGRTRNKRGEEACFERPTSQVQGRFPFSSFSFPVDSQRTSTGCNEEQSDGKGSKRTNGERRKATKKASRKRFPRFPQVFRPFRPLSASDEFAKRCGRG
jgi:hypothetical protein